MQIAFDPRRPTTACPFLLASDGGIARDPDGDCFTVPGDALHPEHDAIASNSGLHGLQSFSAVVSVRSGSPPVFWLSLWNNALN